MGLSCLPLFFSSFSWIPSAILDLAQEGRAQILLSESSAFLYSSRIGVFYKHSVPVDSEFQAWGKKPSAESTSLGTQNRDPRAATNQRWHRAKCMVLISPRCYLFHKYMWTYRFRQNWDLSYTLQKLMPQFFLLKKIVMVLVVEKWYIFMSVSQSVQLLSHVWLFATPWTEEWQASLSITNSWSLLKTHVHWYGDAIQPTHPVLSLLLLLSIFPSIRVFSKESVLRIKWPKYWSFSFNIRPSNEYSGLISFRIDWFDLLVIQGTLKCLCQHHSSKASILHWWAFFMVSLSHSYMTTKPWKNRGFDWTDFCQQSNVSAF